MASDEGIEVGRLDVRERVGLLVDPGSWAEDGARANLLEGLPGDGVLVGTGTVDSRRAVIIAHDSSVKAGSWGSRTVEKQIRALEVAERDRLPVFYLVDSAGGRLTDQLGFYPGRRGAAGIFNLQVRLSGLVPQICCLFGPSAAGGAYMPALCDWVGMVDGSASMYLGSARIVEVATGEKVTLEEMGGARVHTGISGCADDIAAVDHELIDKAKRLFSYLPDNCQGNSRARDPVAPAASDWDDVVPVDPRAGYDIRGLLERVLDADSLFEVKRDYAAELLTAFARLDGRAVGIVASQPKVRGGALFVDSADKGARFIQLCDAYNLPILFFCDTPGFMVGRAVEHAGIIRHGAKMISAMAAAEVPRFCIVVRKAYGAGYYAMSSPGFQPRATLALPTAQIAGMSPSAAVNAVYAKQIAALHESERPAFIEKKLAEYEASLGLDRLASDLFIDAVVDFEELRPDLANRLEAAAGWRRRPNDRHIRVSPV